MSKITSPTTGYIYNGGVVQLGQDNNAAQWDYLSISKPSRTLRILIEGDVPTNETSPNMTASFFDGTIPLFSASGTWGTQGQSSLGANKKNWKLKLKNASTGNKLKVKIGDWFPMSSFTLKGYAYDRTLIRDILTTALWRTFHCQPSGMLAPKSAYSYFDNIDFGMHAPARFSVDGYPCEIWQDGEFLGLYILRSDNSEDDYLMDTSNPKHILTQPQHSSNFWVSGSYNPGEWEYTSPASPNDDTTKACQRFVSWCNACINNNTNIRDTYREYIDLESWIDFILICEIAASYDSMENNFMLGSWDATADRGRWYVWPYDEDGTFGMGSNSVDKIRWVMQRQDTRYGGQDPVFFDLIHRVFRPEIRARWKLLRDGGFISGATIQRLVSEKVGLVDPNVMMQDMQKWGLFAQTGLGVDVQIGGKWSASYIVDFGTRRIVWLDQQLGYSG